MTDLGSPKQLANNVNFLIAAAGALANDVDALKSVDTKHDAQIAQLQKQTILAAQLAVGGTNRTAAWQSPSLPSSRNAQVLSLACLITTNGAVTLPGSCRSNKSNGGDCLHARVLSYDAETNPGGVVSDAVAGQDKTLTQRSALTSWDPTDVRREGGQVFLCHTGLRCGKERLDPPPPAPRAALWCAVASAGCSDWKSWGGS